MLYSTIIDKIIWKKKKKTYRFDHPLKGQSPSTTKFVLFIIIRLTYKLSYRLFDLCQFSLLDFRKFITSH